MNPHLRRALAAVFLATPLALAQVGPDTTWQLLYDDKTSVPLERARFTAGVRPLGWLIDAAAAKANPKKDAGPLHLEFREDSSTLFKDGIVTYVPLTSLLRLEYDDSKKQVRAVYAAAGGKEAALTGSTKFVGINKFSFEGDVAAAQVGLPAGTVAIQDGLLKLPIRGLRIASTAAPAAAPKGRGATVIAADKESTQHAVHELTPLYRTAASQRRASVLMFQKIGQVDITEIAALKHIPAAKKKTLSHDFEVKRADGTTQTLTLLDKTALEDNQPAQLVGLVGRVEAGWKMFPLHTIAAVRFEYAKMIDGRQ